MTVGCDAGRRSRQAAGTLSMIVASSMPGLSQTPDPSSPIRTRDDTVAVARTSVYNVADSIGHRAVGLVAHWSDPVGITVGAGVYRYQSWSRGCCILGGSMQYVSADAGPHGARVAVGAAGWEELGTIGADVQLLYVGSGATRTATAGRPYAGASIWYGVGYAPYIMLNIGITGYIRLGGGPTGQNALLARPSVGVALFGPRLFP
jgi:hypothetical protein